MLISVPFLIVTFLVYALIPELRNLHGKNLMCYVSVLAVGYSLMSFIHLFTRQGNSVSTTTCSVVGYMAYFSFIASFFWLNAMCVDIWWTFRGVRGVMRDAERRKFIMYSLYTWGCSMLILAWCLLVDNTTFLPYQYRPLIGTNTCFLTREYTGLNSWMASVRRDVSLNTNSIN